MKVKMAESSRQQNTPVRHDELSFARKSLRTKVLISASLHKETKDCFESKEIKRLNGSQMLSSTRICETSSLIGAEDDCRSQNIWEESPVKQDVSCQSEEADEDMESFSSDSCDSMEASIIQQKHSTPQVMKFSVRAVSSTPNQENFSIISKLTKNAFTQTNYTLNTRDQGDISESLKSYFNEMPEDENHYLQSSKNMSYFNTTSELSSPMSHMCSKLNDSQETPVTNKNLVRKLSLRSKTIICSALEKSKDIVLPRKILSRHKSMEEKRTFSNTFSLIPQHKTPPPVTGRVLYNPFEVDLPNRLSKTIFSPDVFDNVVSPSQDSEDLRWTIEDISSINPVPIDEDFSIPSDDEDPERESRVQQEIDRYFNETHVVLSPDDIPKSTSIVEILKNNYHTGAAASTPRKVNVNKSMNLKTSATQTNLSLPENLPLELEDSLRSYFKYFEADEFNLSQCNLRRKLFFHTEDEPPSPVRFEMNSSPLTKDVWKAGSSPLSNDNRARHFTPLGKQQEFSSPEMSPVVDNFTSNVKKHCLVSCKKTLHNIFIGNSNETKTVRRRESVNSTAATGSDIDSSSQPASQDTGYHTDDSGNSHLHFSTPTRTQPAS
ncbi:uncharacterized protein LOC128994565 isoform X2 [Macrosteles quadrilineatus]|uniref:uncharacterized protein LOC128994565 isoform X2 n=1 Tax=Macrosteles quadrilineatus TaxID=74068 RepID=UPI0023E287A3|nr:uncharacterized protein LOC128994565 isoform X2 [Macrosteles quadrilineatus]